MGIKITFPDWVKITFTCHHTQKYRYWEIFSDYCLQCDDTKYSVDFYESDKRITEEEFSKARKRYGCGKAYTKLTAKYPFG